MYKQIISCNIFINTFIDSKYSLIAEMQCCEQVINIEKEFFNFCFDILFNTTALLALFKY